MRPNIVEIDNLLGPDLATHDPYDLWKTKLGLHLKKFYYRRGGIAVPFVAPFFILDAYAPRIVRAFIKPQEYPIVRALAALSALNLHKTTSDHRYLDLAACSIKWLVENRSQGYHGSCWGLNFPWMTKGGYYPPSTPFITHTPYCVEALLGFHDVIGERGPLDAALSSLDFLEIDIKALLDEPDTLALGYGPGYESRIVINANSYGMMLYALLAHRFPDRKEILLDKAARIFNFVKNRQNSDGSWFYFADNGRGNFIDCFHSCFVLKNLVKYGRLTGTDVEHIVNKGLAYILENFVDEKIFLARRFTVAANPSLTRYDLYDQAELLNLLVIKGNMDLAKRLHDSITKHFYIPAKKNFGCHIDIFGILNKMTYLRWGIMPLLYALSVYYLKEKACEE